MSRDSPRFPRKTQNIFFSFHVFLVKNANNSCFITFSRSKILFYFPFSFLIRAAPGCETAQNRVPAQKKRGAAKKTAPRRNVFPAPLVPYAGRFFAASRFRAAPGAGSLPVGVFFSAGCGFARGGAQGVSCSCCLCNSWSSSTLLIT